MTLAELSSIGTLISSLAVLVSLAFLSLQMRQTERNQRAMLNQGAINRGVEGIQWQVQADISSLFARVIQGDRTFSAQEVLQLSWILRASLLHLQDLHVQRKVALIDEVTLENTVRGARPMLAQPVFRALWVRNRNSYAPEFAVYVDQLIEGMPLAGPVDLVARLNASLAKLEAAGSS